MKRIAIVPHIARTSPVTRALCIVLLVSSAAGRARAEPTESTAIAEQLFFQGNKLARANRWEDACLKFDASLRYDPALGARLNLATCYERVGKLTRAWSLYRESFQLAKRIGAAHRRDHAERHAAALEARLARLAISAPADPPAGLVVTRDGIPLEDGALGAALYADAGPHRIIASAPGFRPYIKTVTLTEGRTKTLRIPPLDELPVSDPDAAGDPAAADAPGDGTADAERDFANPDPSPSTRTYLMLGIGGTGVAAAAAGLVLGVSARATYDDARALCGDGPPCSPASQERSRQLFRDARSSAAVSTILVAAGGAAIATSILGLVIGPRSQRRIAARILPLIHEHDASIAISERF